MIVQLLTRSLPHSFVWLDILFVKNVAKVGFVTYFQCCVSNVGSYLTRDTQNVDVLQLMNVVTPKVHKIKFASNNVELITAIHKLPLN